MLLDGEGLSFQVSFLKMKNCSRIPTPLQLLFLLNPRFLNSSSWGSLVKVCQKQTQALTSPFPVVSCSFCGLMLMEQSKRFKHDVLSSEQKGFLLHDVCQDSYHAQPRTEKVGGKGLRREGPELKERAKFSFPYRFFHSKCHSQKFGIHGDECRAC